METQPGQQKAQEGRKITPQELEQAQKRVEQLVEKYKEHPLVTKAFKILEALPPKLIYHNQAHTEDVLREALLFAVLDTKNEYELERLAVAAAWHDTGFVVRENQNEEEAVRMLEEECGDNPPPYLKEIKTMMMDTKVHSTEKGFEIIISDPISADLLDSDVSNFGRLDFWEKRKQIAEEREVKWDNLVERKKFLEGTLKFIENHNWHTAVARSLREEQKQKNLSELRKEIADLEQQTSI